MHLSFRFSLLCLLLVSAGAFGQVTTQEDLGAINASQAYSGLGWTVSSSNEQEFATAAAAGATHVRLDSCDWSEVEIQSAPPNNVSGGFQLPAGCRGALTLAKKYDLQPTLMGAYGAPYHQILSVKLIAPASVGATTLAVEYISGVGGNTLANISYPYAYVMNANGQHFSYRNSYEGTLITDLKLTSSTTAVLTLSSALFTPMTVGTSLEVNQVLYPSAITGKANDPSVLAYARYIQYLASQLEAYGLQGDVELWNEPPWSQDCWDNRRDCYDNDPKLPNELASNAPNYGFVAALQNTAPVPGVTYGWAGTNKSGSASLLFTSMAKNSGATFKEPQPTVTFESMHPYGSNPEDLMWNETCLKADPKANQLCNLFPESGSNMVMAESLNLIAKESNPAFGIKHSITETGSSSLYMGDEEHKARFAMRQYLGYMADGFSYIEFYRLYDRAQPGQTGFSFLGLSDDGSSFTPLASYTAIAGLMSDLTSIKSSPVTSYTSASLPAVTSYDGTYNLDHVALVGSRAGDKSNSVLYALWQRSFMSAKCGSVPCWGTLAQPPEARTTVSVPNGMKLVQAVNLDTRALVPYTQSGSQVEVYVSDDPIELLFVPANSSTSGVISPKLIFAAIPTQLQGNVLKVSATSTSSGTITYSVLSGSATVSGSLVTVTGPGTVVLEASQAAKGSYSAATTTTSFTVTAKTPNLNFAGVGPKIFGDSFSVLATSVSKGAVSYSVASGPATISGTTVQTTGAGTIVLKASQVANGPYTPAIVTMSVVVRPKTPVLVFKSIPTKTFGDAFDVSASSASNGGVTYSVVSGPATISGSAVTLTGHGQVLVRANQVATANYNSATATASFYVKVAVPTLVFASVGAKTAGAVFTAKATSDSNAAITYSVLSGPATHKGSTITLTGAGTVVLQAYQTVSANGGYTSATARVSFVVSQTTPNLAFSGISSKSYGDIFSVSATSASDGAVTYSVLSGPAHLSGSTIKVTSHGQVLLKAIQAASGAYASATAFTSFYAAADVPTLKFSSISKRSVGDVFAVSTSSNSSAPVIYSVISGPALSVGSTIKVLSAGTITLQAYQTVSADGAYTSATAKTSFVAN